MLPVKALERHLSILQNLMRQAISNGRVGEGDCPEVKNCNSNFKTRHAAPTLQYQIHPFSNQVALCNTKYFLSRWLISPAFSFIGPESFFDLRRSFSGGEFGGDTFGKWAAVNWDCIWHTRRPTTLLSAGRILFDKSIGFQTGLLAMRKGYENESPKPLSMCPFLTKLYRWGFVTT